MAIDTTLLNKLVNIGTFLQDAAYDDFGDNTQALALSASNVAIRLTRNRDYIPGMTRDSGYFTVSELKGFILPTVIVYAGDYMFDHDNYKVYEVTHVNEVPGGVTDHHQELFLKRVEHKEFDDLIYNVTATIGVTSFTLDCLTMIPTMVRVKIGTSIDESTWGWKDAETIARTSGRSYLVPNLLGSTKYYFKIYLWYPTCIQELIFSGRYTATTAEAGGGEGNPGKEPVKE